MATLVRQKLGKYVAIYGSWIVSCALGLLAFVAAREALITVVARYVNKWARSAVVNWSMLLFGLVWLVAAIYLEDYYRKAYDKGLLARRLGKATLYELIIIAVATAIIFLLG